MSDNSQLDAASTAGDIYRSKDRAGVKTQIIGIDIGIGGTESLMTIGQHAAASSISVVLASDQTLPLPTGAATETTLASINTKLITNLSLDYDTGAGTQNLQIVGFALPASGGAVPGGTATNPLRTDPTGTTTQPVSLASIPLAATAATEAKQDTGNTSLASIDSKILNDIFTDFDTGAGTQNIKLIGFALPASGGAVVGGTSTNPLRTDPTGTTTQPISAASLPLPTGAATDDTLTSGVVIANVRYFALFDTGSGSALNALLTPNALEDYSSISIAITGTFVATYIFEVSNDATNWFTYALTETSTGTPVSVSSSSSTNKFYEGTISYQYLRIRISAYTSGTVTASTWRSHSSPRSNLLPAGAATETTLSAINTKLISNLSLDYDTSGGTQNLQIVGFALPASGGAVAGGTATNPLRTDPVGTTSQPVDPHTLIVTGTGAAVSDTPIASTDCLLYRWVSVQLTGPFVATANFECSNDGAVWNTCGLINTSTAATAASGGTSVIGQFVGIILGRYFRVRVSAYTSGTITATALFTSLPSFVHTLGVAAAQNGTWTVQPGNTANTTPWLVSQTPSTSGGLTPYSYIAAASANQDSQVVKGSAGQLYGGYLTNTNAAPRHVKIYDKATGPISSDTPKLRLLLPGNANGAGGIISLPSGAAFANGIGIRITTGVADTDATAVAANDVIINLLYK